MLGHSFDDMFRLDDMEDVAVLKGALNRHIKYWASHEEAHIRMTKLLKRLDLFTPEDF